MSLSMSSSNTHPVAHLNYRLTHLPRDNLAGKSQTTFSNAFSSIEMIDCLLKYLKFIPEAPIDNNAVLAQVMAWRRQATSHYLNQCWPSFLTHICGTRGRWVKYFLPKSVYIHCFYVDKNSNNTIQNTKTMRFCERVCWLYMVLHLRQLTCPKYPVQFMSNLDIQW